MAHAVSHCRTWLYALAGTALPALALALGPAQPFGAPAAPRSAEDGDATPVRPASRLGGLRLGHLPAALIDGQWIRLGETLRGARLQDIQPPYALLRHPDGRLERLALDPHQDGAPTPTVVEKKTLP